MEILNSHFKFQLLLMISYLPFFSTAYTLSTSYFINCGSSSNTTLTGRNFVGDLTDRTFYPGNSTPITATASDPSTPTNPLYQTSRIYNQSSSFELQITQNSTYIIRLHFYPFSSPINLSHAIFNISVSGCPLLHDFTTKNTATFPLIKEFFLYIEHGKVKIDITPLPYSFAFMNAIEIFNAPGSFISDNPLLIRNTVTNNSYNGLLSQALHTIHRVNVGNLTVTPDNDTLWRTWLTDDNYLLLPTDARNSDEYSGSVNYFASVNATEDIAPPLLYRTAKELTINSTQNSNISNITWVFETSGIAKHFVRLHFCDIVTSSAHVSEFNRYLNRFSTIQLDLYINTFSMVIDPYKILKLSTEAAPFFLDFVVDRDDSGLLSISVGSRIGSSLPIAFLNGVEIMEVIEKSGSAPLKPGFEGQSNKNSVFVIVGSVSGCLIVAFIVTAAILFIKCKRIKAARSLDFAITQDGGSSHRKDSPAPYVNLTLKRSFAEIKYATNRFKKLIGEGGFGKVYEGTLRVGIEYSGLKRYSSIKVAVKRSSPGNGQGISEFQTEILVLSKIRHRHLVSLIGYCEEGSEMILIYEFMEKGTLRDHLYGCDKPCLSWNQRLEICIGAAKGLEYLHTGTQGGIIHRDVKPSNILLDENWVAKVADFGLSRSGVTDATQLSTDVKGSFGYLDPECFKTLQWTDRSDVYSFGVVLLEVLCARPAVNILLPSKQVNLAEWAISCQKSGMLEEIIDPFLVGKIKPKSLEIVWEITEKCLNKKGDDRPSMRDVVWDLEFALKFQEPELPMRLPATA